MHFADIGQVMPADRDGEWTYMTAGDEPAYHDDFGDAFDDPGEYALFTAGVEFYDHVVVVELAGVLDRETGEQAAAVIRSFWPGPDAALVLDLEGLVHLDRRGATVLLRVRRYARASATLLVLAGLHGEVAEQLERYGLIRHFEVVPDHASALELAGQER
ncbi:STAS domain-containing protein [Actinomadura parmotrematis]|uniref:STAS domain-containing protein n=1 Tax=Actinomadura parmotrematis TaxID=2864039 RepID=A0ABS7FPG6_9ACTN|nr:STAS domain-containing protein [Actinomadura parmotrematis]MBW8482251.1 STAS domain-containing protein [Actinomadura parmotrematis]